MPEAESEVDNEEGNVEEVEGFVEAVAEIGDREECERDEDGQGRDAGVLYKSSLCQKTVPK